jgi:hypothetical protein
MGERAIYTVTENGETGHLYSQWGADFHTLFAALHTAENLRNELRRPESISEILSKVDYNRYFDYSAGKGKIFDRLDEQSAQEMLSDFGRTPAIQMHITLDLDNDMACAENSTGPRH